VLYDWRSDVTTLKSMTYKCIGLLGKRLPELFSKNFELLKSFFETIANEKDQSIRQSLQGVSSHRYSELNWYLDGLVNLIGAYANSDADTKEKLLQLLFDQVKENNIQSKYLANYYCLR
jgi:hypothetical protein